MQIFDLLTRVREVSPAAARLMLARLLPRIIPLSDGMRIRVDEWTSTRTVLSMPLIRKNRNHLGSVYFGAQMSLADLTVGALLFQRYPMGSYGGVIKRFEASFQAKAKGRLTCVAELTDETAAALDAARTNDSGKSEAWIPMVLRHPDGTIVTETRALVAVKRYGRPESRDAAGS